ncbi:MAG: SPOR domain-containing protein [Candidatus Omnitrophica bacterium]|nr:SPOR domain-containing protein [Candidatus Omnitrophota bacterium]
MLLFNKKKETVEMKPMTEEDIQRKLYGSYKGGSQYFLTGAQAHTKEMASSLNEKNELEAEEALAPAEELFSFGKDEGGEIGVRFEEPGYQESFDKPAHKEDSLHMSPLELDEHIWEESKSSETVQATFKENIKPSIPSTLRRDTRSQNELVKDFVSSLKIDLAEFVDKIKGIPSGVIIAIITGIVFFIIIFNIWSRANRDSSFSSSLPSPPTTTAVRDGAPLQRVSSESASPQSEIADASDTDRVSEVMPLIASTRVQEPPPSESMGAVISSFYSVQVCVYEDALRAENLTGAFKKTGEDSFFKKITTRSGRDLYTVYLGHFGTLDQADIYFNKFRKSETFRRFPDSFIKYIK